ncbi:MAG: nickel pincer cofactor biosynthesis protein LarC [Candidatus Omnitrophota bacterium]|nr:nickel pincer cofactor biosynthesis protein LarC [Candidatus Omnitrophota bacterium]
MRIAYLDCFSGISGDMTIGAFLDAGLSFGKLSKELAKLKLKGYRLSRSKVRRGGIAGTKFACIPAGEPHSHCSLKSIISTIEKSPLKDRVKEPAKKIFSEIAAAEAKVHGKAYAKDIIFHELGDVDSIVDIVGTAIAIDELGIDKICSSNVSMGRTIIRSRHGNIPAPSPASLELLRKVPVSISDIDSELVTPTGAGILKALSKSFGPMPQMKISAIGYGAGSKEISERPNMLRVLIGETAGAFREDSVYVVETNIDDMNPQHIGYAAERLLEAGALDAYITNIQMKKSRPAFKLTAVADAASLQRIARVIFNETSAIGLRFYEANRMKLDREFNMVKTAYGEVKVKVSKGPGGISTVSPEHDDCVRAAKEKSVSLRKVYEAARIASRSIALLIFLACGLVSADTVTKNNGEEVKGVVVEDYKDRIVLSTVNGENTIMKSGIKELYYDEEGDNLIKLADRAKEKRDYIKALTYYGMAFKADPNSKAARDGLVFLQGYLFRKEQAEKEEDVRKREDVERRGAPSPAQISGAAVTEEKAGLLKKAIGITIDMKDGFPVIKESRAASPAYDAGIRQGDRLIAIWARLTGYMELGEVIDAFLDKPALELKCAIERPLEMPRELTGVSLGMEFDGLTAASVRQDTDSYAAGLRQGDIITRINGKSTRYMPLNEAVSMIRKSKGGTAGLTIKREVLIWRRD